MKSAQQSLIPLNVLNINKTLVSFLFHLHLFCSFFSRREEKREKLFFFFYLLFLVPFYFLGFPQKRVRVFDQSNAFCVLYFYLSQNLFSALNCVLEHPHRKRRN